MKFLFHGVCSNSPSGNNFSYFDRIIVERFVFNYKNIFVPVIDTVYINVFNIKCRIGIIG